jgi:hypothetical protein
MVFRDVHGLLRSAGALDRRVGEGEDGVAALEVLKKTIDNFDIWSQS